MGVGQGALRAEAAAGYQMLLPASASESASPWQRGPCRMLLGHIPHHCSHRHCHLLTGGWSRGAAIFNQVAGRAQRPRCPPSPICQPLCLLSHPLPEELAAKHGVRGLSEGPSEVGEPAEGKSSGSAR